MIDDNLAIAGELAWTEVFEPIGSAVAADALDRRRDLPAGLFSQALAVYEGQGRRVSILRGEPFPRRREDPARTRAEKLLLESTRAFQRVSNI